MHQDGVAGLHARPAARRGVAGAAIVVVGAHQARERRFLPLPFIADRIHVIDLAALSRLRLGPGADGNGLRRVRRGTGNPVRIGHDEARFVGRVRLEVEDAAGKHVRQRQVEDVRLDDPLTLQAQQRHGLLPRRLTGLAIRHRDRRVAVGVAFNHPFEAEVDERRRIDDQFAGGHARPVAVAGAGACPSPRRLMDTTTTLTLKTISRDVPLMVQFKRSGVSLTRSNTVSGE